MDDESHDAFVVDLAGTVVEYELVGVHKVKPNLSVLDLIQKALQTGGHVLVSIRNRRPIKHTHSVFGAGYGLLLR